MAQISDLRPQVRDLCYADSGENFIAPPTCNLQLSTRNHDSPSPAACPEIHPAELGDRCGAHRFPDFRLHDGVSRLFDCAGRGRGGRRRRPGDVLPPRGGRCAPDPGGHRQIHRYRHPPPARGRSRPRGVGWSKPGERAAHRGGSPRLGGESRPPAGGYAHPGDLRPRFAERGDAFHPPRPVGGTARRPGLPQNQPEFPDGGGDQLPRRRSRDDRGRGGATAGGARPFLRSGGFQRLRAPD